MPPSMAYQVWEWMRSTVGHGGRHRQVGAEHPQRRVRALGIGLGVRGGTLARLTHALHVDVDQLAELRNQLGHVHPGAAVDRRRVLAGEEGDAEAVTVGRAHAIGHRRTARTEVPATRDSGAILVLRHPGTRDRLRDLVAPEPRYQPRLTNGSGAGSGLRVEQG